MCKPPRVHRVTTTQPPRNQVLPQLILKNPFCKLWHKTDSTFRRPKSNLYIDVVAPVAYEAPANVCLCRIFTKLLEDELTEFAYDAQ